MDIVAGETALAAISCPFHITGMLRVQFESWQVVRGFFFLELSLPLILNPPE